MMQNDNLPISNTVPMTIAPKSNRKPINFETYFRFPHWSLQFRHEFLPLISFHRTNNRHDSLHKLKHGPDVYSVRSNTWQSNNLLVHATQRQCLSKLIACMWDALRNEHHWPVIEIEIELQVAIYERNVNLKTLSSNFWLHNSGLTANNVDSTSSVNPDNCPRN